MYTISMLFVMILPCTNCIISNVNPYKLFGVSKFSSDYDIEIAYKALKDDWLIAENNNHPEAKYTLEKIEFAYQILIDPDKRSHYDVFGSIELNNASTPSSKFHVVDADHIATSELYKEIQLTTRIYENTVKLGSYKEIYIICVSSNDHSQNCLPTLLWNQLYSNLSKHSIHLCKFNGEEDRQLTRRLGVSQFPNIVGIMNGKISHYSGDILSIGDIMGFVYNMFESELVTEIRNSSFFEDIGSNIDSNKVSIVLFTSALHVPLSYLAAAFNFQNFIKFSFSNFSRLENFALYDKLNVSINTDTVIIFKENRYLPSFRYSTPYISRWALDKIIKQHHLLILPRISNQNYFNYICPPGSKKEKKRLCVILLANKSPESKLFIDSMREYAERHTDADRVKFAYLYEDTQKYFVKLITWESENINTTINGLKVVVIWRIDDKTLSYDFLEDGWFAEGTNLFRARRKLTQLVGWSLTSSNSMQNYVNLKSEIIDEYAKSIWIRIMYRLHFWAYATYDQYLCLEDGTCQMIFFSLCIIFSVGLVIKTMISREQNYLQCINKQSSNTKKNVTEKPTVYIYALSPSNYDQLVTNLDFSVRLILLLVDEPSKANLLQYFGSSIVQYSKSKAFRFGFLQLEEYLSWYRRLLESTIQFTDESLNLDINKYLSKINARNCLGTVLAINGAKKYYFMYHISVQLRQNNKSKEDSDSENENAMKLFESDLLKGLPIWLEKLCQGKLKKFKVSDWPESMLVENVQQIGVN